MKYIYDLHQTMLSQNLILVYEGEFTQEITKSVLAMAERNMDSTGEESSIKRKVFNVMVECLQNIVKHSDEMETNQSAIFMIGRHEGEYLIMSGNPIKKANIDGLKARIDKINSLDKDGLKSMYKDIIKNTEISDKGGAGLGFVDMARKSGKPLEYEFQDMDDKYSFFCLKTTIGRS
ncbi:MAG: SiaB family protein kinase [Candidatus Cyclobacteriaceae bacterium M2_1C_046]